MYSDAYRHIYSHMHANKLWEHSFVAGPGTAASIISIAVPAWMCGLLGGMWSNEFPPRGPRDAVGKNVRVGGEGMLLFASFFGPLCVLAGAFGASHDAPLEYFDTLVVV
jgi:hypothetical protein